MSETKFVKPSVDGARIPDPALDDDLPAEGREVRWSPYWRRLEMRGDVVVGAGGETPPAETPPAEDPPSDPPAIDDPAPRRSRYAPKPTPPSLSATPSEDPPATTDTPGS